MNSNRAELCHPYRLTPAEELRPPGFYPIDLPPPVSGKYTLDEKSKSGYWWPCPYLRRRFRCLRGGCLGCVPSARRRRPRIVRAPPERGGQPYPWSTHWELRFGQRKDALGLELAAGPGRANLFDTEEFLKSSKLLKLGVERLYTREYGCVYR